MMRTGRPSLDLGSGAGRTIQPTMVSLVRPAAAYLSTVLFQSSISARYCWTTRRSALAILLGSTTSSSLVAAQQSSVAASAQNQQRSSSSSSSTMLSSSSTTSSSSVDTGYLNAADAAALDAELMATPGFTLEQLMELAGLSVAEAVYQVLEEKRSSSNKEEAIKTTTTTAPRILLICGPGNNGGDSLVAARHLVMFGYQSTVVYPKRSSRQPHYANLVKQCQDLNIPVLDAMPDDWTMKYDCVVDSIFGFSFQGEPRPPFDTILQQLKEAAAASSTDDNHPLLTVAVDIPSGWNVNGDDEDVSDKFLPDVLVSLTAPKLCARQFRGRHFVGGRFLPPALADKYRVRMPPYPGVSQVVEVTSSSAAADDDAKAAAARKNDNVVEGGNWQAEYAAYLLAAEEKEVAADSNSNRKDAPAEETWQAQYAAYCAEKEAALSKR